MKKDFLSILLIIFGFVPLYSQTYDEVEPNNSFTEANLVGTQVSITATTGAANDVDFFQVDLATPGVLTITLTDVQVDQRFRLYAYNSLHDQIGYIAAAAVGDGFSYDLLLPSGISIIKVYDYNGVVSSLPYHLILSLDTSDGCEPNNSFTTACTVSPNTTLHPQIFGVNSDLGGNDYEYYKLELPTSGVVTVSLFNLSAEQRMRMRAYNSLQEQIAFKESPIKGTGFSYDLLLPAGVSYISLNDYNNNSDTTHLELTLSYDTSDPGECNNSFETAFQIAANDTLYPQFYGSNSDLGGDDSDYFKIQAGNCFNQCFAVSNVEAGQRIRLHVYDEMQKQVGFAESPVMGTGFSYCLDLEIGSYYLKLYDYNAVSSSQHITFILSNTPSMDVPVITQIEQTLQATEGTTYQWFFNDILLDGANEQILTPENSGIYTVWVTGLLGCGNMSAPFLFTKVGIDEQSIENSVTVFPNPTTGSFTLSFPVTTTLIQVYNAFGQMIETIPVHGENLRQFEMAGKGIYLIKIQVEKDWVIKKIMVE